MQQLKLAIAVTTAAFLGLSLNLVKHYKSHSEAPETVHMIAESTTASRMARFFRDLDRHPSDRPRIRRDEIDDVLLLESLSEVYWTMPAERDFKHSISEVEGVE